MLTRIGVFVLSSVDAPGSSFRIAAFICLHNLPGPGIAEPYWDETNTSRLTPGFFVVLVDSQKYPR